MMFYNWTIGEWGRPGVVDIEKSEGDVINATERGEVSVPLSVIKAIRDAHDDGCSSGLVATDAETGEFLYRDFFYEYAEALPKELLGSRLCYVEEDEQIAYFTTNFEKQWGDDWNDAPYQHNAGTPYTERNDVDKYRVFEVRFKSDLFVPAIRFRNIGAMGYSVRQMNEKEIPWLLGEGFAIWGGDTFQQFRDTIKESGGVVFDPILDYATTEKVT